MSASTKIVRLVAGTLLVVVIFVATFALLPRWMHTWGATEAEVARTLPGDELIDVASTTHAKTIDAPPEEVWPWIAQLGDDRGGFYSYTFIQNLMMGEDLYHNANRILPQFQDPQPGEGMIVNGLRVHAIEPGRWLMARSTEEFNWVWLWYVEPLGGNQTRLLIRSRMIPPAEMGSPVVGTLMDVGAFVMGRRMVEGIALRAEGRTEPAAIETIEIVLWPAALVAGLGAAVLFLTRRAWQTPLLLGLAALFTLIWFTFWQPPLWLRLVFDVGLFVLLWRMASLTRRYQPGVSPERSAAVATVH